MYIYDKNNRAFNTEDQPDDIEAIYCVKCGVSIEYYFFNITEKPICLCRECMFDHALSTGEEGDE